MKKLALVLIALAACDTDLYYPTSFPSLVDHGGERLVDVHLVTITYPNDPLAHQADAFDDFVLRSDWLRAVGGEYGVRGGRHVASVRIDHDAPAAMTAADLFADLQTAIQRVGGPRTKDGERLLFLVYLPASTSLDAGLGTSCVDYGGYHSWLSDGTPYAVIADCGEGAKRSITASHEIIEAATDPHLDALYVDGKDGDREDPWYWWDATEVGDMCEFVIGPVEEGGYELQRSWSQAAASEARPDPCVPVPPGDVWADLDTDPHHVLHAHPGDHLDVALRAWSSRPSDPWTIDLILNTESEFAPAMSISRSQYFDGDTGVLSLDVPADASAGERAHVHLWSGGQLAPVEIVIDP